MKKLFIPTLIASAFMLSSCSALFYFMSKIQQEDESESVEEEIDWEGWSHEEREDVIPSSAKKYTILMYVCGSTLEYGPDDYGRYQTYGAATEDIQEVLNCSNQPSSVNVVIETGGAGGWSSSLGINKNYLQRYHVSNQSLVLDSNETKASMGKSSTLESFVDWGIRTYPAEKYGLILWNHGGAASGVCVDSNFNDDCLTASEVYTAVDNALAKNNRNKLEWIGYDACIMSYLDLASVNADIAKYMIASQELENGDGWDYEDWIPTLYSNPSVSTVTLLSTICDSFVSQYGTRNNDQTLAVMDLSKMKDFTIEFNKYTKNFQNSDFSSIKSIYNSGLTFGEDVYGIMDFADFISKASSKFSYSTTAVESAFNGLVVKNKYGNSYNSKTTKPCGINVFIAYSPDYYYGLQVRKTDYTEKDTKFTFWRTLNIDNGFK